MREALSSKIEKIVQDAKKTKKTVVFLGGSCKDNSWREEIQKDFGDHFFFIDPYDENYEFKDNVYDELAGMVNADYVVFYRGGDLTEHEKAFLDNIDRKGDSVKQFEDIDKLRSFLKGITGKKKLASVSVVLRRYAQCLCKDAVPIARGIDLYFERMTPEDKGKVVKRLNEGKSIIIPEGLLIQPNVPVPGKIVNKNDITDKFDAAGIKSSDAEKFFKQMIEAEHRPVLHPTVGFDEGSNTYFSLLEENSPVIKTAKMGATYSKASTQVDLPEQLAREIMAWGKANIPDKDLYTKDDDKGREDEIHVTLFYGIVEDAEDKIREMMSSVKPFECRLGLVTAFKDEKEYDVLKIDVESPEMVKLHYLIQDNVKNKNDHPTYTSHITIAYMKKDKANKLIGEDRFRGTSFKVTEIVYSTKDHNKIKIPLGS